MEAVETFERAEEKLDYTAKMGVLAVVKGYHPTPTTTNKYICSSVVNRTVAMDVDGMISRHQGRVRGYQKETIKNKQ